MTPLIRHSNMDLTQTSGLNPLKPNWNPDTSMPVHLTASQAVGDIASSSELTDASAQEIYDMQEATESLQETNANKDAGSVLSGIITMLGNLIAALQSMIESNGLNAEGVNNDTKVNPNISVNESKENDAVEKSNNNTATANVGDVVDVKISGVGLLEDAEYMDNAAVNKYFSDVHFDPNDGMGDGPCIDMHNVADVYKKPANNGGETLYFVDENGGILYVATFREHSIPNESKFYVDKYTDYGDYYLATPVRGATHKGGNAFLMGGQASKKFDKDGNFLDYVGRKI